MKKLFFILIFIFIYAYSYEFISKFLSMDTNSPEYRVIKNPEAFSLEKSALIISGLKEDSQSNLLDRISNFEAGISNEIYDRSNPEKTARFLFLQMHKNFLKEYDQSETTIESAFYSGKFDCLTSTILYNSILEDFGIEAGAVILPTHVFSVLNLNGREIHIETTIPYGYDIGSDTEAQETFKKLTGFSYSHDLSIMEITGKKGLIGYYYANKSYYDHKSGRIYESFQDALKAWAVYPEGGYIYSNILAAYSSYGHYLSDVKKDYKLSLSVLDEAIYNLPQKDFFLNDYYYVLNKYIDTLVDNSLYDKAFDELDSRALIMGTNTNIRYSAYINVIYRLINHDGDFEKAYKYGKKAMAEFPDNENMITLMINGMSLLCRKLENDWQDYPKEDDFLLKWYGLDRNVYFDSILENHYNILGSKFYEYGDPLESVEVLKKGLSFFPKSVIIKNNIAFVTGKTSITYFSKEDYENSIKFLKMGLESDPGNQDLKSNLIVVYRTYASREIEDKNYTNAVSITEDGLKIFPKDPKLRYYRDYLRKKLK